MALPPCHMFCQFYVTLPPSPNSANEKPKLSCLMYQRSCDLGLGIPFNIASYALLTHMMAVVTDTEAHEFILQMGDAHVYSVRMSSCHLTKCLTSCTHTRLIPSQDHIEPLKIQLEREPRPFPKLVWTRPVAELAEAGIDGFKTEDFAVEDYKPHAKLEMKMSV